MVTAKRTLLVMLSCAAVFAIFMLQPRSATATESAAGPTPTYEPDVQVALAGLDPVHLVEGREALGTAEIIMDFEGFRYQFVSEPSRQTFAADPARFAIQNDTCPVVPGAAIDGSLISVYEGRIYAFASPACVGQFEDDPARYVETS